MDSLTLQQWIGRIGFSLKKPGKNGELLRLGLKSHGIFHCPSLPSSFCIPGVIGHQQGAQLSWQPLGDTDLRRIDLQEWERCRCLREKKHQAVQPKKNRTTTSDHIFWALWNADENFTHFPILKRWTWKLRLNNWHSRRAKKEDEMWMPGSSGDSKLTYQQGLHLTKNQALGVQL